MIPVEARQDGSRFTAKPWLQEGELVRLVQDRWGLLWQITPRTLTEAMAAGGAEARRAFSAMMTIDVAAIDAARRG